MHVASELGFLSNGVPPFTPTRAAFQQVLNPMLGRQLLL